MSTPSILTSPFLTHNILDTLLSQSPSLTDRINLLSAKIHLYANPAIGSLPPNAAQSDPGTFTRSERRSGIADRARWEEMHIRVKVAGLWLEVGKEDRAAYMRAEAELGVVIDWTKGALKGIQRRKKEKEKRNDGIGIGSDRSDHNGRTGTDDGAGQCVDMNGAEDPWEEQVRTMKRNAEGMMVLVQIGLGREDRAERLRRQMAQVPVPQS